MKKLYALEADIKNHNKARRDKIFLGESQLTTVQRSDLFAKVKQWLDEHQNEEQLTYPGFINLVMRPYLNEFLTQARKAEKGSVWEELAARVTKNEHAFYTILLFIGADKEDANQVNFKAHVEALADLLYGFRRSYPVVRDRAAEIFISIAHDLARQENDKAFRYLEEGVDNNSYYPPETKSSFASIQRRSKSLIENFELCRAFTALYNNYKDLYKVGATNTYSPWTKDIESPRSPFTPSDNNLERHTGKMKIVNVKLTTDQIHQINKKDPEITDELLDTHGVVAFKNLMGNTHYCINNPELLQEIARERE